MPAEPSQCDSGSCGVLTVQAEGDVDGPLLCEALQIRDLGTFEVCG